MDNKKKEDKQVKMEWTSENKEKDAEKRSDESVEDSKKEEKSSPKNKGNRNLSAAEMRVILDKYEAKYSDTDVEPFILSKSRRGTNRFYVLKAIMMDEVGKIDEMVTIFHDEETSSEKANAERMYLERNKLDNKETMSQDQKDEMQDEVNVHLNKHAKKMVAWVQDKVMNILGVAYPEDHKDKVMRNKALIGDVQNISIATQVLSGWSGVSTDIDVYEKSEELTQEEAELYDQL